METSDSDMRRMLLKARVIAVVGHSDDPTRTSYQIAQYLRQAGYTVYPVNPTVSTIDGRPSYPTLADVPEPIDIVNVFRRSVFVAGVMGDAVNAGARGVWTQLGVIDEEAARRAQSAGLNVVMDRCIKVEHRRLLG